MRRAICLVACLALGTAVAASEEGSTVELTVAGPPIEVEETGQAYVYREPEPIEGFDISGFLSQHWSMLGREDLSAATGDSEYTVNSCMALREPVEGEDAVISRIVEQARQHRLVIINESHVVTRHRDFSRKILKALASEGYSVLAAETFANLAGEPDPVDTYSELPFIERRVGSYSKEPVFGALLREAKALDYRFAAYEITPDPERSRLVDIDEQIAQREQAQAENLAEIVEQLEPHEKLIVHVGYSHAREIEAKRADGFDTSWMAARLKRMTGIDPLTIAQTVCRGTSDGVRLSTPPEAYAGYFDLVVDHPLPTFAFGKPAWRFDGVEAVPIPEELRPSDGPLVIEAFIEGEPFDAVPVDRIYAEPGDDVRLALPPGRYVVRAVRVRDAD